MYLRLWLCVVSTAENRQQIFYKMTEDNVLNEYSIECLDECSEEVNMFMSTSGSPKAQAQAVYSPDDLTSKTVQLWSEGETRSLLDKYAIYLPQIGPLKLFKNKKEMWTKIGSEIGDKNCKQCEQRYKTIMKRKKIAVENNMSTGAKRKKIAFEEELEKISKIDDSIHPEVCMSSQEVVKKSPQLMDGPSSSRNCSTPIKAKPKTVQETMLEIFRAKEEAKERRHKEKMEKAENLEALLLKLIERREQ